MTRRAGDDPGAASRPRAEHWVIRRQAREFLVLFLIQCSVYSIFCVNARAIAKAHFHTAAVSDFMLASLNFWVIRKIAADSEDSVHRWAGYALGSVAGSYLGIWVSKTYLSWL